MTFTLSCSDNGGGNPIKKAKISGVSQKGPFVEGSTATLYELDESLSQTGRSFRVYRVITIDGLTFMIDGLKYAGDDGALGRVFCDNVGSCNRTYAWDDGPSGWRLPNDTEAECISGYDEKCDVWSLVDVSINSYFWSSSSGYVWGPGFSQTDAERYSETFDPVESGFAYCVQN